MLRVIIRKPDKLLRATLLAHYTLEIIAKNFIVIGY